MIEESVTIEIQDQKLAVSVDLYVMDRTHGGFFHVFIVTKTTEVMGSEKCIRRLSHRLQVIGAGFGSCGIASAEDIGYFAQICHIAVVFGGGI